MTLYLEVAIAEAPKNNMKSRAFNIGCFLLHSTMMDEPLFYSLSAAATVREAIKAMFDRQESLCIFPGEFGVMHSDEHIPKDALSDLFIQIRTDNNRQRELAWNIIESADWQRKTTPSVVRQPSFYLQTQSEYVTDQDFSRMIRQHVFERVARKSDLA